MQHKWATHTRNSNYFCNLDFLLNCFFIYFIVFLMYWNYYYFIYSFMLFAWFGFDLFMFNKYHCFPPQTLWGGYDSKAPYNYRFLLQNAMGWLRFVGSLKLQVSFAECSLFYRALLKKGPIIFYRSLSSCKKDLWEPSNLSFFLGFRRPNLITGLSRWRTSGASN